MDISNSNKKQNLVKKLSIKKDNNTVAMVFASLVIVLFGTATGWFLSGSHKVKQKNENTQTVSKAIKTENEAGIEDESVFSDTAEGILLEGGMDGEGTHQLDRGFGPEKNVYLTSTVIDLQSFVGKKVKVWGETIQAQKVGWLMDVGKIKITE